MRMSLLGKIMATTVFPFLFLLGITTWSPTGDCAAATNDVIKIKFSYQYPPAHFCAVKAEDFAKQLRQAAGDRIEITTFGSGSLYKPDKIVGALGKGVVQMGSVNTSMLASLSKDFMVEGTWFMHTEQIFTFWEGPEAARKAWAQMEAKTHIKRLAWVPIGPYVLATKEPVRRLEDFAGLSARYPSLVEAPNYKALNMKYLSVPTAEVYTALERGMVNAVASLPSAMKGYGWWDYLKYWIRPYVGAQSAFIGMNMVFWNRLPNDLKEIFLKVGEKISKESIQDVMDYSNAMFDEVVKDKGGEIITLPPSEVKRIKEQLEKGGAYAEFKKEVSPAVWDAYLKYTGN